MAKKNSVQEPVKYGIRIPTTGRYVKWADNWYETDSACTTTYTKEEVVDVFDKLSKNCYIRSIEVVDEDDNVVDTMSVFAPKKSFGTVSNVLSTNSNIKPKKTMFKLSKPREGHRKV